MEHLGFYRHCEFFAGPARDTHLRRNMITRCHSLCENDQPRMIRQAGHEKRALITSADKGLAPNTIFCTLVSAFVVILQRVIFATPGG